MTHPPHDTQFDVAILLMLVLLKRSNGTIVISRDEIREASKMDMLGGWKYTLAGDSLLVEFVK